jgi:hypothetical protein
VSEPYPLGLRSRTSSDSTLLTAASSSVSPPPGYIARRRSGLLFAAPINVGFAGHAFPSTARRTVIPGWLGIQASFMLQNRAGGRVDLIASCCR